MSARGARDFYLFLQFCARQEHRHCNTGKSRALKKRSHHFRREQPEPAQTWGHAGGLKHTFARFPLAHCQQHTPNSSCTQPAQEANTEPPQVQLWKDMPGCALKRPSEHPLKSKAHYFTGCKHKQKLKPKRAGH